MSVLKVVTVVVLVCFATTNCGDLRPVVTSEDAVDVISSNLPKDDQTDLASKLQEIYENYPDPVDRILLFTDYFDSKYEKTLNNAAMGHTAAAYDQKVYIEFTSDNEKFDAWGA